MIELTVEEVRFARDLIGSYLRIVGGGQSVDKFEAELALLEKLNRLTRQ